MQPPQGFLRTSGSVAVAARATATASATTSFAVTAASTGSAATATTTSTAAATTLAVTTSTAEAATTAPGLTSNLVEAVVGSTVGLGSAVCCSLLTRRLHVPRLACGVAGGGIVGPAGSGLRLRCLGRCSSWGIDLLVGPRNDLVVVLNVLVLSTSSRVPALACSVALGLCDSSAGLLRSGNAVSLRLLELGQASVRGGGV
jgi:hypothetical protein